MGGLSDGTFDLATKSFGTFVAVDQLECGGSTSIADPRPCISYAEKGLPQLN
jgi:hypothetical protein